MDYQKYWLRTVRITDCCVVRGVDDLQSCLFLANWRTYVQVELYWLFQCTRVRYNIQLVKAHNRSYFLFESGYPRSVIWELRFHDLSWTFCSALFSSITSTRISTQSKCTLLDFSHRKINQKIKNINLKPCLRITVDNFIVSNSDQSPRLFMVNPG